MRAAFLDSSSSANSRTALRSWCTTSLFTCISETYTHTHTHNLEIPNAKFFTPTLAITDYTRLFSNTLTRAKQLSSVNIHQCHLAVRAVGVSVCARNYEGIYRNYSAQHVIWSVIIVCVLVLISFHLCAFLPCAFAHCLPSAFADLSLSSSSVLSSFAPLWDPLPVHET